MPYATHNLDAAPKRQAPPREHRNFPKVSPIVARKLFVWLKLLGGGEER